ncbi:MAG TPA: hypothetical protein ENG03_09760 [Thioploca sp.]|nr:MAG: hypothetical protein DRR19_29915 [Gammaproteobacteria bacterium]HDN27362.1 hypothetical protein [Thioploca sp.]
MIKRELHNQKSHKNVYSQSNHAVIDLTGRVLLEESERTRTEVWTRVMGYHRPVSAFNPGKQSEHAERRYFQESRTSLES